MELEEMQSTWSALSKRVEKQENITNQIIEEMTQKKYNSKLNKIVYSEYIGTIVCFIAAVYLILNLTKIENTPVQILALASIALLFILPIISLKSLHTIKSVNITSKTYLEAINSFASQKIRFQKFQKLNVLLGFSLVLMTVPVLSAIQGKDLSETPYFWSLIFPFFILIFLAFAFWVLKSYNKVLNDTERMLADIDSIV